MSITSVPAGRTASGLSAPSSTTSCPAPAAPGAPGCRTASGAAAAAGAAAGTGRADCSLGTDGPGTGRALAAGGIFAPAAGRGPGLPLAAASGGPACCPGCCPCGSKAGDSAGEAVAWSAGSRSSFHAPGTGANACWRQAGRSAARGSGWHATPGRSTMRDSYKYKSGTRLVHFPVLVRVLLVQILQMFDVGQDLAPFGYGQKVRHS
jgi:hypothetical protein